MADPIYRMIADELRREIESGQLASDSQLSTELELRERFNASRNTVRDAVKSLIAMGLVETRPGQGTFVTRKIEPYVTILSEEPETGFGGIEGAARLSEVSENVADFTASDPRVEIQAATGVISSRLQIDDGTQVVSRHQQRRIKGIPWSLQTTFYPMQFVLGGATKLIEATNISQGAVRYLQEKFGLKQTGYRDWITGRVPDSSEIDFFELPTDGRVSVFEVFRTAFDQNGTPMRLTITVFAIDRNQFIVNVGDVPSPAIC
ncbi:MAG TPA: GntR family transcriptional regulator [Trebonia sp.]|nr:GntR family transcriptional regulator [Trebonia sp.]